MEHHAVLLVGGTLEHSNALAPYRTPGPDVHHLVGDTITIDDVRALKARIELRPVLGSEVVAVLAARSINLEAQQALLKLLEEPPVHARLFILVRRPADLLPTVRSRLAVIDESEQIADSTEAFETFLTQSYADRLAVVAERTKDKDLAWIEAVVAGAESYAAAGVGTDAPFLRTVIDIARWQPLRGASPKLLLEELALSLPLKK